MTDNPTGAENAQVQDDADGRAREILDTAQNLLDQIGEPPNINDSGFCGCGECQQCLLECAHQSVVELIVALREAEQREAIVWEFAVARHVGGSATRDLVKATANDPEYRNRAIERAATPEAGD